MAEQPACTCHGPWILGAHTESCDVAAWFRAQAPIPTPLPTSLDPRYEPFIQTPLLDRRGATHGDYRAMSTRIQQIKAIMRMGSKWTDMSEPQKEALELIATKIGRIIEGDPEFKDHWDDLGGYAAKASEFCRKE